MTVVINNVVGKGNITMGKLEIKKRIREYSQQLCQRFWKLRQNRHIYIFIGKLYVYNLLTD